MSAARASGFDPMIAEFAAVVAISLAIAFAGRVALAILPPGPPGGHALGELPMTWATAHLLGLVAWLAGERVLEFAGIEPNAWLLLAPWIVIAIVRLATLPGAVVPRHELRREPPSSSARIMRRAAFIILAVFAGARLLEREAARASTRAADFDFVRTLGSFGASGMPSFAAWCFLLETAIALLLVCEHGLERARRAPLRRALALVAIALLLGVFGIKADAREEVLIAAMFGSGAAFAIPWMRRADRRGLALSVIFLGATSLFAPRGTTLAIAGLLGLWIATPAPSRRTVGAWSLGSFLLFLGMGPAARPRIERPLLIAGPRAFLALDFTPILIASAVLAIVIAQRRLARTFQRAPSNDSEGRERFPIESDRPESRAVGRIALWAILLQAAMFFVLPVPEHGSIELAIGVVLVLIAGLECAREERRVELR